MSLDTEGLVVVAGIVGPDIVVPVAVAQDGSLTVDVGELPAAVALADNLANPTTTEIGANLLLWDATNNVWRRARVVAGTGRQIVTPSDADAAALADNTANPTTTQQAADLMLFDGATWDRARGVGTGRLQVSPSDSDAAALADADPNPTTTRIGADVSVLVGSTWDRFRRATGRARNVRASAAGDTQLVAAGGAGVKTRIFGYHMTLAGNAVRAAAGIIAVQITDGAAGTVITTETFWVNNAAINTLGGFQTPWVDLGQGYLGAANTAVQVNLSAALTAGDVNVVVAISQE